MKVLCVCTGNTCRSPMAAGLLTAIGAEEGRQIQTLSAGLFTAPGARVSEEAVAAVAGKCDISDHVSRPLQPAFVQAADAVLAMTDDHKRVLLRQYPADAEKIYTLAEWAGETEDVDDPYGLGQDAYDACAAYIEQLIRKGLAKHTDWV